LVFWFGYKLLYKTKVIPPNDVDLISGKREIDEQEEEYIKMKVLMEAGRKQTIWHKIWSFV
jgi:yeast amino acid transporter